MLEYLLTAIGAYIIYSDATKGGKQHGQKVRKTSSGRNHRNTVRKQNTGNSASDRNGGIKHDEHDIKHPTKVDAGERSNIIGSDSDGQSSTTVDTPGETQSVNTEVIDNDGKEDINSGNRNNGNHVGAESDSLTECNGPESD